MAAISYALAVRYLSGHCTDREREKVEAWSDKSEENRLHLENLRQIWVLSQQGGRNVPPADHYLEEDWQRIRAGIGIVPATSSGRTQKQNVRRDRGHQRPDRKVSVFKRKSLLAAVMLLMAAGLWVALQRDWLHAPTGGMAYQEVVTQPGQRARIPMGDGTFVMLNVSSKIRFPSEFTTTEREVFLEGEAFFDVTENAARPFKIYAQGAVVEVLGTSFNLRAYEDEQKIDVVVTEGRVSLKHQEEDESPLHLTAMQMGRIAEGRTDRIADHADIRRHIAWMDGRIVFEDTPLRDVASELQRWYPIEFGVDDPVIANRRLTATFTEDPIREVLTVISTSLNVRYEFSENQVMFFR